jgi:hypothetical protein
MPQGPGGNAGFTGCGKRAGFDFRAEESFAGAEARVDLIALAARLKSCPDKKQALD